MVGYLGALILDDTPFSISSSTSLAGSNTASSSSSFPSSTKSYSFIEPPLSIHIHTPDVRYPSIVIPSPSLSSSVTENQQTEQLGEVKQAPTLSDSSTDSQTSSSELPSPTQLSKQQPETYLNISRRTVFLTLSPILIPIGLTFLTGLLTVYAVQRTTTVFVQSISRISLSLSESSSSSPPRDSSNESSSASEGHDEPDFDDVSSTRPTNIAADATSNVVIKNSNNIDLDHSNPFELETTHVWLTKWIDKHYTIFDNDTNMDDDRPGIVDEIEPHARGNEPLQDAFHNNDISDSDMDNTCNHDAGYDRYLERILSIKSYAVKSLNLLEWERYHVYSNHPRAHATIIRRSTDFTANEDVVLHFVEQVFNKKAMM